MPSTEHTPPPTPPTPPPPPPPPPPFIPPDVAFRQEYELPLVKVQGAIMLTFLLLVITILFGLLRSRVTNTLMKSLATVLFFPLSNKLLSFVPGLMELHHKYDLLVLWFSFLTYLGAVANNYSCYRFGDNEDRRISLFMDYIFPWGTIVFSLCKELIGPEVLVPVLIMFWMVLLKFRERRDALRYATRTSFGLVEETKVVVDFMNHQKNSDGDVEQGGDGVSNFEPNIRFLVGIKEARSILHVDDGDVGDSGGGGDGGYETSVVILEKIKDQKEKVTGSSPGSSLLQKYRLRLSKLASCGEIKDQFKELEGLLRSSEIEKLEKTCFSFALFWMLLAKVAGHDIRTDAYNDLIENSNKTSPNDETKEVERIFEIIEVEIDFLYEYFYTNYYSIYVKGLISKFWHLCIVALFFLLTLPLLVVYRPQDHSVIYVDISDHVVDNGLTRFVIIIILLIELAHICLVLTSNWAKIIYLCDFVQRKPTRKLTKLAIKYSSLFSFSFRNKKIAQYSLKKSYNSIPPMMCFAYFVKELQVMNIPEVGQTGIEYIPLDPFLKKPFIRFLKESKEPDKNVIITNGERALAKEHANELTTRYIHCFDSHSEVILVWHLATHDLMESESSTSSQESPSSSQKNDENKRIAKTISGYCAYLVVFATQFLPDSHYTAQCVFKMAIKELNNNTVSEDEFNKEESSKSKKSITKMANDLKVELKRKDESDYWKLLANFWIEMLLYLSLANNFEAIEAHADHLCTGGELITQLWALVNHAGCVRDPKVIPKIKTRMDE